MPPIQNYSTTSLDGGSQNWSITQDSLQHIFVANNAGLLKYNGVDWKLLPAPNGAPLKSLNYLNGLLYSGMYKQFGYWKPNEYGLYEYTSLSDSLNIALKADEEFWNIVGVKNWVLFQSLDRIYIYNTQNQKFEIIEQEGISKIYQIEEEIYFHAVGFGLFTIKNGKAELLNDQPEIKHKPILGVFKIDKHLVLVDEDADFYSLQNGVVDKLLQFDSFKTEGVKVYNSIMSKDGSFLLGTVSNGFIRIAQDGTLLENITKEDGLNNNTILSVFEDDHLNIWLGLDNGVSLLNQGFPMRIFEDLDGDLGATYTSLLFEGYQYIGTNQGLYFRNVQSKDSFSFVEGTEGQVWKLVSIDGTLFCGHNEGTFIIDKNKAEQISTKPGTWDIKPIPGEQHKLIQGNYKGFSILEKNAAGNWYYRNNIEGIEISTRFFEFSSTRSLYLNNESYGMFKVELSSDLKSAESEFIRNFGYGSSLVRYKNSIYYTTNENQRIHLIKENGELEIDSVLSNIFYNSDTGLKGPLVLETITKTIWGITDNSIIAVRKGNFDDSWNYQNFYVSPEFRKQLGVTGFENVSYLGNDLFLIGTTNGYLTLNLSGSIDLNYPIQLNQIEKSFRDGRTEKVAFKNKDEIQLKSNENNLNFGFNAPNYYNLIDTQYQYKLNGYYDEWSPWASDSEVSFSNLNSGNYTLMVRSKVGNSISSNILQVNFKIATPWYATLFMITVYLLSGVILLLIAHRKYTNYYREQRDLAIKRTYRKLRIENLEREKELMQFKNENLRLDVASKTKELSISTHSLVKKNELLSDLKSQLKKVNSKKDVGEIIDFIDSYLNDSDDWEQFERAFNNSDKEFFIKIKERHPDLTPNDLKICAYLRINLTSKEIAPLLNISIKSVEVKRYRLRKKLELNKNTNLVTYILSI
ncbi:triple tyrosine motif-containing protein [Urechidicola sp. KH5]